MKGPRRRAHCSGGGRAVGGTPGDGGTAIGFL